MPWVSRLERVGDVIIPEPLKPPARTVHDWIMTRRFEKIKEDANGMLTAEQYHLLYDYSKKARVDGNFLEIGAAHGASTISLALGLKDNGTDSKIVSIEKATGGSRDTYGNKEENIRILERNLRKYSVVDQVELVTDRLIASKDTPPEIIQNAPFSLIFIDADGNLGRDFELFYDLLVPGSIILIDDYNPMSKDQKCLKTFAFVNHLVDEGWLIKNESIGGLLIAHKPIDTGNISLDQRVFERIELNIKNDLT